VLRIDFGRLFKAAKGGGPHGVHGRRFQIKRVVRVPDKGLFILIGVPLLVRHEQVVLKANAGAPLVGLF
jgi:hypothetical protein